MIPQVAPEEEDDEEEEVSPEIKIEHEKQQEDTQQ